MQAVILAGGKGTRLASRLNGRPKPLVEIDGKPLLERQLRQLAAHDVDEAVILVNHAADQIADFLRPLDFGCRVTLIDDGEPRGTSGATLACLDQLRARFLVVYGDTLFDIDVASMVAAHTAAGAEATLLLHPNDHPADSDLVEIDDDGRVTGFHAYPHPPDAWLPNLVNAAFYVVEKSLLRRPLALPTPSDFAKDLFPAAVRAGARLYGYRSFEYIKDIGTPKRLDKAEGHLRRGVVERARRTSLQPAVFVDRDVMLSFPAHSAAALALRPDVPAAIRRLNDDETRVAVIGRAPNATDADPDEGRRISARLETGLGQGGAYVDRLYDLAPSPERSDAAARLIERGVSEINIDRARSFVVTGEPADVTAAQAAGLCSILVKTADAMPESLGSVWPDFVVDDLAEAVEFVLQRYPMISAELSDLVSRIAPGDLVLVGGLARSGKSTAAAVVAARLRAAGIEAGLITLDRWIRPLAERKPGVHGRFDLDAAQAALRGWLAGAGGEIALGGYNRFTRTNQPSGETLTVGEDAVVVLEGVLALDLVPQTGRAVHRILVEADETERRARVVADLVARGSTPAEAEAIYQARMADEAPVVQAGGRGAQYRLLLDKTFQPRPEAARDH